MEFADHPEVARAVQHREFTPSFWAFDPLSPTNHCHLWHRGFPIQLLADRFYQVETEGLAGFDIQADLWNGDPDVDAICRMQYRIDCDFDSKDFPFASKKPAPFNSQNTFLTADAMRHYCMLPAVGRSDDIWPAYHLQAQGFRVIFGKPSVRQERNPQDVMKNFEDELMNYRYNLTITRAIASGDQDAVIRMLPERAALALKLYQKHFE